LEAAEYTSKRLYPAECGDGGGGGLLVSYSGKTKPAILGRKACILSGGNVGPGIMYGGGEDGEAAGCGKSKNKSNSCGIPVAVVAFAFDMFCLSTLRKREINTGKEQERI
jgi:hypothetical protein